MNFEELIESHNELFEQIDEHLEKFLIDSFDEDELETFIEELGLTDEELEEFESISDEELLEELRRRVTARGNVTRIKSRQARARRATQTTGMSRTARRQRARRAARTRRRNPGDVRRAIRKRNRAMQKRRQMNVQRGS